MTPNPDSRLRIRLRSRFCALPNFRLRIRLCAHLCHAFTYILHTPYHTYWIRLRIRFFPKIQIRIRKCSRTIPYICLTYTILYAIYIYHIIYHTIPYTYHIPYHTYTIPYHTHTYTILSGSVNVAGLRIWPHFLDVYLCPSLAGSLLPMRCALRCCD